MIYLIGHLAPYLIAAFLFAAFAGWTVAAQRSAPEAAKRRRERERILREFARAAGGEGDDGQAVQNEREADALRRRLTMSEGRITELESALARARARADEVGAELESLRSRDESERADVGELARLRGLVDAHEEERAREVDVVAEPVSTSEAEILQMWRLRYFEQRVKYLEDLNAASHGAAPLAEELSPVPEAAPQAHLLEWRVREAEARAAYLADEARARALVAKAEPSETSEASAFAADVDVDALLRWRMLYLERRVAHLQNAASASASAPMPVQEPAVESAPVVEPVVGPDPDIWKWRARYLEARLRHLQTREPVAAPAVVGEPEASPISAVARPEPVALAPQKPPTLAAARNGAPDDLTLIESVSVMQHTMLNAIGIYHFDQIAAWSEANVAWVDRYFRLRGRVAEEEWVEQAGELARDGVVASRRLLLGEEV